MKLGIVDVELERFLTHGGAADAIFAATAVALKTEYVPMRDGTRLATDLYFPPVAAAPIVVMRTPYGRNIDRNASAMMALAQRGYTAIAQDCRGTGASEPDHWDYYVFEAEDGFDCVEWIAAQSWYGGFIGSIGGSYTAQTQWAMALHPLMSAIIPHVSGLGIARNSVHLHMFNNGYARTVGKGDGKLGGVPYNQIEMLIEAETMASGFFNEPLSSSLPSVLFERFPQIKCMGSYEAQVWLWRQYCALSGAGRAQFIRQAFGVETVTSIEIESISRIFGQDVAHDTLSIPHTNQAELCASIRARPLIFTGWYDWGLNDALATWEMLRGEGRADVARDARLIIAPTAHATPGYHEGAETHPELQLAPSAANYLGIFQRWYERVRGEDSRGWPSVIYYLMGANEWRVADDWPIPGSVEKTFYLCEGARLSIHPPDEASPPDPYVYDPNDPTPTVGGSIVSYLYTPGSVDVSAAQRRSDVLTYTTEPMQHDLDVVGPLRVVLFASSSAVDTDFCARLSDVFPDGRAIQLQNCVLRARHRKPRCAPSLLAPGRVYEFEIDLWATANRFKAGHRLRLDISSADFPKFDRNANRGGEPGAPVPAMQTIYHDAKHPSRLLVCVPPPNEIFHSFKLEDT